MDDLLAEPVSQAKAEESVSPRPLKRKKAPAEADEHVRKRVTRACEPCRRLKEKCNGVQPCTRCARYGRPCRFDLPPKVFAKTAAETSAKDQHGEGHLDPARIKKLEQIVQHFTGATDVDKRNATQLDELLHQLEEIAQTPHPADAVPSEGPDAGSDDEEYGAVATPHGGRYLGELSHNDFSNRLQNKVQVELHISNTPDSARRPSQMSVASPLQSKSSLVTEAIALVPPSEVAYFLVRIFFDYGQTNYHYVDETLIRDKLRELYSSPMSLDINDAPWVCIILLILAVGTQFAHLDDKDDKGDKDDKDDPGHLLYDGNCQSADDQLALRFYQSACKMIPDVLAAASVESVQAFLLFGIYSLPIDVAGLACSYFGMAIRLATLNGMHRDHPRGLDPQQVEVRRRIWWTAYTLERRMCILHGRPISIPRSEVQCSLPSECPDLQVFTKADNTANSLAMITLSEMLETARDRIVAFRRAPRRERGAKLLAIQQLQDDIDRYWNGLPGDTCCRDLDPAKPLFRSNLHLTLMYHLVHVFIGRSLILRTQPSLPPHAARASADHHHHHHLISRTRARLVARCIDSAVTVIHLCQTLDREVGIARASYTEFSSCSAALLAVLARRIAAAPGTAGLQTACDRGLRLLKKMSVGIYANSEKLTVEALETAVRTLQANAAGRLQQQHQHQHQQLQPPALLPTDDPDATQASVRQAYARFRDWATLQHGETPGSGDYGGGGYAGGGYGGDGYAGGAGGAGGAGAGLGMEGPPIDPTLALEVGAAEGGGLLDQISLPSSDSVSAGFDPFYLGDFGAVPGLDEWFKYGLR